jgi:hypothetical protein
MENFFKYFFRFPLYRFVFSTILGLLAFLFIFYVYASKKDLGYLTNIFTIKDIPTGAWILIFFLFFFLGEIFALLGEVIINLFFDYNPLRTRTDDRQSFFETFFALLGVTILKLIFDYTPPKDYLCPCPPETVPENQPEQDELVEKLTPFSSQYITYNHDYKKFTNETLFYISEFHLIFGRTIAGLSLILFIFGSIQLEHDILFIFVIDILIIFILYISISKPSFVKFCLLIFIILLFYDCYKYLLFQCYSGAMLILLSLLLFLTSANYRAFSNNILRYSVKTTLPK